MCYSIMNAVFQGPSYVTDSNNNATCIKYFDFNDIILDGMYLYILSFQSIGKDVLKCLYSVFLYIFDFTLLWIWVLI